MVILLVMLSFVQFMALSLDAELDFRFPVGAPLHGINDILTTNQLKTYDKARNAVALALSPVVKALVDPDGAMSDIRDLDSISFSDWFLSKGGTLTSIQRMWDPVAYALGFIDCDNISTRCMLTIFSLFATKTEASLLRMLKACDVPRIKRLLPSQWREMQFFNDIYELVGVPVVTVQLRYNGWVKELQDVERSRQLRQAVGLDNLLYTPDADFFCFADLALTSPEDYYIEGQGSLLQTVETSPCSLLTELLLVWTVAFRCILTPGDPHMPLPNEDIIKRVGKQVIVDLLHTLELQLETPRHSRWGVDDDVTHRIKAGWLKWKAATGVLCDKKVPLKLKGKFYRMTIRPALLYGSEYWAIKKDHVRRMEAAEMRMFRWACGRTMWDMTPNSAIRMSFVVLVSEKLREGRLRWFGHVLRRQLLDAVRRVESITVNGAKRRGRPRRKWEDSLRSDLKDLALIEDMPYDRKIWRLKTRFSDCRRSSTKAALNLALRQPTTLPPSYPIAYENRVSVLFPSSRGLEVTWSSVVKIGQSLYREGPGKDPFRPDQKTPTKNFFLAGSYIKQDYIDSTEGATLSGRQASAYICDAREELVALQKKLAAIVSQQQIPDELSLV
ncbi:Zeta-carotene desaturase [Hibiscus syriacus]|uniref:Zeta-carotene desaturase n=1 Tax=Hibiscus syriacus TaxID=106335 RepID=A0A6A2YXN6_HIBSY|nr:Zeta-carotene desaturase [Hibiscus syriacus]